MKWVIWLGWVAITASGVVLAALGEREGWLLLGLAAVWLPATGGLGTWRQEKRRHAKWHRPLRRGVE